MMKKKAAVAVTAVLCAGCILTIGILFILWRGGFFVTDRSAKVGSARMIWNGASYSLVSGDYTEGQIIAKSEDGAWNIKEVKEDPTHTFLVARSFLDQYLYVSDEYAVPASGEITAVCWGGKYIQDTAFLQMIAKIESEKTASFTYQTEGIFMLTEHQHMKRLYYAYEDCPVATEYKGYMGKVEEKWVITTYISSDQKNKDGSPKPYYVSCYAIPDEYVQILERYFK